MLIFFFQNLCRCTDRFRSSPFPDITFFSISEVVFSKTSKKFVAPTYGKSWISHKLTPKPWISIHMKPSLRAYLKKPNTSSAKNNSNNKKTFTVSMYTMASAKYKHFNLKCELFDSQLNLNQWKEKL